jgi:hypothetical protein
MKKLILMLTIISLIGISVLYAASIEVTWNANTETDLAGYGVYDNNVLVGTVGVLAVPTFTIPNVAEGTHVVNLDAFDNATPANRSGKSDSATIVVDLTAPAKKAAPTAVVTGSSVKLTWIASTEADIDGYVVYADGVLVGTTTGLTYTISSLIDGSHSFTIEAVDKSGNHSIKSDATVVKTDTTSPVKPNGIKLLLKN